MNSVTLITTPQMDAAKLIKAAEQIQGRKIRGGEQTPSGTVHTLGTVLKGTTDKTKALREAGGLLKHVTVSFLIVCAVDTLQLLLAEGDVEISYTKTTRPEYRLAFATGSLQQWKTTFYNCCAAESDFNVRQVLNGVVKHFDDLGLSQVFHEYKRRALKDTTFYLEYKE